MKIAKKDIALVMVIVALIAAFCAYKFSLSVNLDKVDEEETKQATLQSQIDEVKARANEVQKMDKEIAEWQVNVTNWMKPFHSNYLYEDGIMYLKNLEDQKENDGDEAFGVRIDSYTIGEAMLTSSVVGQGSFSGQAFMAGKTTYNYRYQLTGYDDLKDFINYLVSEKDGSGVKSLDSMSFSIDHANEEFEGNIVMSVFSISDGTNTYNPQDLTEVEQKIESNSIFGNLGEEEDK